MLLLVEDNTDDVALALRAFEQAQVSTEIVVARNGVEALELIHGKNPISPVDVVLLDLKLPKLDGLEVLQQLRRKSSTKLLPVVILSSSAEASDINKSYEFGANSYIRKPVDYNRFTRIIKSVAKYWLETNVKPVYEEID